MSAAGDMLRLARQWRGFTQQEAAARMKEQQAHLSRVENGTVEPNAELIGRAAAVYSLPLSFFQSLETVYGPPVSVHPMTRKRSDVTARELNAITAELNIRLFHLRRFLENVDYRPTLNLPVLDIEDHGEPSIIAAQVRAHLGLPSGPVRNLTATLEKAGVIIGMSDFYGASVSGVTFRAPGHLPLIVLNGHMPADRLRYTLAHELGHLVMHRFPTANMEDEANEFASAFLMPEDDIRSAFIGRKFGLELLAALKPEWKVAMQALLIRAENLGVVTSNQARYLWQQIAKRGWRTSEPPELDFALEQPKVLGMIIHAHLNDLGYQPEELIAMARVGEQDFESLYGRLNVPHEKPRLRLVR